MNGEMDYMARNTESRRDIRAWMPDAKSVLICGFSYAEPGARPAPKEGHGRLARYAVRSDYHPILRGRMNEVGAWLASAVPGARGVAFCDMSPILERSYAAAAGLGWQGKNTMLLGRDIGSYFLLAGLALNIELPADPAQPDHCGSCTRCLDACPTDAFPKEHVLDASKCIAYFTIESKHAIPEPFREGVGDWVYGCDICQEVCPWNAAAPRSADPAWQPRAAWDRVDLLTLAQRSDDDLTAALRGSPMQRAGVRGLRRNLAVALSHGKETADEDLADARS
jgi:epoxyqueuosine reductase